MWRKDWELRCYKGKIMYSLSINTFQNSFNQTIAMAKNQPVEINTEDGTVLILQIKSNDLSKTDRAKSPFDIEGIDVPNITSDDILQAIRDGRERHNNFDFNS